MKFIEKNAIFDWFNIIVFSIIFLSLLALRSFAGEIQARYGLGIEIPEPTYKAEVKHLSFAYQTILPPIFIEKSELGFWFDDNKLRSSSGFIAHSIGLRVQIQQLYAEVLWGICLISTPDNVFLSGHLQFMQDLGIGIIDELGRTIGISYKHISNAGLQLPNKGRDALQIQVGFPMELW